MPRFRLCFFLIAISLYSLSTLAQPQAPPPKPQTARQALIEMVMKGGDAIQKHLTVEVQDVLKSKAGSGMGLALLNSMKAESGWQSFETGEVLFAFPGDAHMKYEVRVDNDDLAGDQDSVQLSIHAFRDGKELDEQLGIMASHFTVSMKLQQNIWRVDRISVGAEFPIGDPKFFGKTFLGADEGQVTGLSAVSGGGFYTPLASEAPATMAPEQTVRLLAMAEGLYARQHPETGFTCSISDLTEMSKLVGVDQQATTGSYNGYRFALSGCEGKPAGSFQVTAEPLRATPGAKAFCTDATQNLRVEDNGQGATCLASGKIYQESSSLPEPHTEIVLHTNPEP